MVTCTSPSPTILLPYMHSNIAQICRWWVAAALIAPVQIPNTFPIILQSSSASFLAEAHAFDLAPLLSSKPSFITETLQHPYGDEDILTQTTNTTSSTTTPKTDNRYHSTHQQKHLTAVDITKHLQPQSDAPDSLPQKLNNQIQQKITQWYTHFHLFLT